MPIPLPEKSPIQPGDRVLVFEDPLTGTRVEGWARVERVTSWWKAVHCGSSVLHCSLHVLLEDEKPYPMLRYREVVCLNPLGPSYLATGDTCTECGEPYTVSVDGRHLVCASCGHYSELTEEEAARTTTFPRTRR